MQQFKALHEVREDKHGNTSVPNALCVKVASLEAVLALLHKGAKHRAVRHTEMNMHSSRSHAILQLVVEQFPPAAGAAPSQQQQQQQQRGTVLRSKLNFVDLAGNERWNKEVDMGAERVGELTSINSSLSALATVVAALTEGHGRGRHVPYRDSKLTHLLQDSLGGNCQTTIVATVSPSVLAFDETVSTLKFADRASAIGNNPVVNTSRDLGSVLALKEREIARLRQLLAAYMEEHGAGAGGSGGGAAAPATPGGGGGAAEGGGGDAAAAQQLLAELEQTRRALEMERTLRAELEEQLKQAAPATAPPPPWPQLDPLQQQQQQQASAAVGRVAGRAAPAGVDYLRVVTPAESSGDFSSPTHASAAGAAGGGSNPFKAVMTRRAELGLAPSQPGDGGAASSSSALGSPARFRDLSPQQHHRHTNHPARLSSATAASGGAYRPYGAPPPLHHGGGGSGDHSSSLEATMRSIRQQVMQLTVLEQENRQRMAAMMSAGRAARASASPQRARRHHPQQPAGGPASVYGGGGVHAQQHRRPAPAPPAGILDSVESRLTPTVAAPARSTATGPHDDSFDQLVSAAHASVQQSQQAVTFPLPSTGAGLLSQSPTPDGLLQQPYAPSSSSSSLSPGMQSWGRSALLRASGSMQQADAAAGLGAVVRQSTASSSLSAPVTSGDAQPLVPGGGWGRSALLGGAGGSGGAPLMPSHAPPLSAPPANAWGRSAVMQQHHAYGGSSAAIQQQQQQQVYGGAGALPSSKPSRNLSARSPGRLDKGEKLRILPSQGKRRVATAPLTRF